MRVAAKALSLTARDLFLDPQLIEAGRVEFELRRGENFRYKALLGNREPPLDYRIK
jgi:aminobenzoyl-glutamate utilization protein B